VSRAKLSRLLVASLVLVGGCSSASTGADASSGGDAGSGSDGASVIDGASSIDGGSGNDAGPRIDGGHSQPLAVQLGASGDYVLLAMSGISTVPASAITGDIAVSPGAATLITGFSLTIDSAGAFATSAQITGHVFAADYAVPTPANLTAAISDMQLAFTDAAGRAPDVTELGAGDVGGMTLPHGVYAWGTGLSIPTDLTLAGSATDVWIFQIAQDLTIANGVRVSLTGGALPQNVFWQVAGRVELGTTAHCEGIVLTQTAATLGTGASVVGRLLAQTAVSLDASTVVEPAP
jgi:hypothetical protein